MVAAALRRPLPWDGRDGRWGWLGPAAVALVAGILRFWRLGDPPTKVFDELYYASDAQDYLRWGVEYDPVQRQPDFVVHPPAGKWVIAAGERIFGDDAFGWRFAVAVLGTLAVLMTARIGRRLFRSTLLGCTAGLLLALDGTAFVESRTALLDPILMFWVLAAFGALLVDRDRFRERLAAAASSAPLAEFGPSGGLRAWRLVAGVCLGLACATKWNGVIYLAVFGLLTVLWDAGARRAAGVPRPYAGTLLRDAAPAFASLVLVTLAVYIASWTGWFRADAAHAWSRDWAATRRASGPGGLLPDALRSLWHYHQQMWDFHQHLREFHPYKSNPWSWLIQGRPTSFFYEGPVEGQQGCQVAQCSKAVTSLGTPAIWWAGVLALLVMLWRWAGRRDWRAGAILAGVVAGYLPWFHYQERTIYAFYSVVFLPFVVLAVTMCLGLVIGRPDASPARRTAGATIAGAYLLVVIANFAWLYPILSAQVIPYSDWFARMWLRSWI
jgi:dolichyl-phosphate-mannose--protein O-mannosyl transferase